MAAVEGEDTWGILGGTFDPVHVGHLNLADHLRRVAGLDRVLLVPAYKHPFKHPFCTAAYEHRASILKLALTPFPALALCEIEAEEDLPGYTVATVRALKKRYPDRTFCFIIGADNVAQLQRWHQSEELLQEVVFLVGTRPGFELTLPDGLPADRFALVETRPFDVSSSQLRRWMSDENTRERAAAYIPPAAWNYIEREALYR